MTGPLDRRIQKAVRHFWNTRDAQSRSKSASTARDVGFRSAVTGGKQMDGFIRLIRELLVDAGMDDVCVYVAGRTELPGYFRAEKKWDVVVVVNGKLVASIELKSQIGPSFGNNFNNRSEEAIGSATDLWTAFREGAFRASERPWLGYLMLLEDTQRSNAPVVAREPHFPVFPEFAGASYAKRYEILLIRLVRERLYDAVCFIMSSEQKGPKGQYREPCEDLTFQRFAASLVGHAVAVIKPPK